MGTTDVKYDPDEREQAVLEVLREHGRANPMLIRDETGIRKQYVSQALSGLEKAGLVEKLTRGLYDHVPEMDDGTATRGEVDRDKLERALDDAEAAAERNDEHALQEALQRARNAVQNNQ